MNLSEIIAELRSYGMEEERAIELAIQLLGAGVRAAAYRIKTINDVHKLRQPAEPTLRIVTKDIGGKVQD